MTGYNSAKPSPYNVLTDGLLLKTFMRYTWVVTGALHSDIDSHASSARQASPHVHRGDRYPQLAKGLSEAQGGATHMETTRDGVDGEAVQG